MDTSESAEESDSEQCGFQIGCGKCKSKRCTIPRLSCCNNAKFALVFLCCAVFFQSFVVNGLVNTVISTIEKRFNIRSYESGIIVSSYDIGFCVSVLVVSYFGDRGHKPLWIGWGLLITAVGSILFSLPHFVAPTYSVQTEFQCNGTTAVDCGDTSIRAYLGFFIASQLLIGIGSSPLLTLAVVYIDDNVKLVNSSAYHGIFYAFLFLGPGIGFLVGSTLLRSFTNFGESVAITALDVRWVGNWWFGFLIAGFLLVLTTVPWLMYPKHMPDTERYREERKKNSKEKEYVREDDNATVKEQIKTAGRCVLILLKNHTLILISLLVAMDVGLVSSLAAFGPKYIETMFSTTASNSGLYFGIVALLAAVLGHVSGGFFLKKLAPSLSRMMVICVVCCITSAGLYLVFLIKCPDISIAGVTVPHNGDSAISCPSSCGCRTDNYDPVCGADDLTYVSFCDGGCQRVNTTHFNDCTRVLASDTISQLSDSTAVAGSCPVESCSTLIVFLIIIALSTFVGFFKAQSAIQITLRCVPFNQRSLALGFQLLLMRLLGSIPAPIIFGRVLDSGCLVWNDQCGECGSCKAYDKNAISNGMTIVGIVVKLIGIISVVLAWILYKENSVSTGHPAAGDNAAVGNPVNDMGMTPASVKSAAESSTGYDNAGTTI